MSSLDSCVSDRTPQRYGWLRSPAMVKSATSRAHEAGFDEHLVKPVDFETLYALLTRLSLQLLLDLKR